MSPKPPKPNDLARVGISRLTSESWQRFRSIRLAALAESSGSFASAVDQEQAFTEEQWRAFLLRGATFEASVQGEAVGLVAGIERVPPGLGSLWVEPSWRGSGLADRLVDAVAQWASLCGHDRLTLWAITDDLRACRFYERQGFRPTGKTKAFPGSQSRIVQEMVRALHGP